MVKGTLAMHSEWNTCRYVGRPEIPWIWIIPLQKIIKLIFACGCHSSIYRFPTGYCSLKCPVTSVMKASLHSLKLSAAIMRGTGQWGNVMEWVIITNKQTWPVAVIRGRSELWCWKGSGLLCNWYNTMKQKTHMTLRYEWEHPWRRWLDIHSVL